MKPNQRIFICGDFNSKYAPFDIFTEILPLKQMTFQRHNFSKLIQSRTDHITTFPNCQFQFFSRFNELSDHAILCVEFLYQQKIPQQFYYYRFSKQKAYQLNTPASSKFTDFTCFYNFILKNLRSQKVILKIKRQIIPKSKIYSNQSYLKLWNQLHDLAQNNKIEFYKKLKRIVIMNPNKKEGGIFSYILNDQDNLQFGDVAINECLNQLSLISNQQLFAPQQLPSLPQLSLIEISEIKQLMSNNKAISFDGISDTFIKKTTNLSLFQNIWQNSTIESNKYCCRARLIPLNRVFPSILRKDQFRPITILSPLYKLLELRFLPKLQNYLTTKLSKDQSGFIPFSSTQINITNLLNMINQYKKKSRMNCIFIDFSCAFNTVDRNILYQIISQKNILDDLELQFLRNLHSNMHYISPLNVQIFFFANGVPQGSSLSPALFNIYLEEFLIQLKKVCNVNYTSFQFADDIVTIIEHKNTLTYLENLINLQSKFNLKINKSKCGIFHLHNHQSKQKVKLFFDFPIVKNYKYLGVQISNDGKLFHHIMQLERTITYLITKINWLTKECNWQLKLQLWQTFILPHIIYFIPSTMTQNYLIYKINLKKFIQVALKRHVDFLYHFLIKFQALQSLLLNYYAIKQYVKLRTKLIIMDIQRQSLNKKLINLDQQIPSLVFENLYHKTSIDYLNFIIESVRYIIVHYHISILQTNILAFTILNFQTIFKILKTQIQSKEANILSV